MTCLEDGTVGQEAAWGVQVQVYFLTLPAFEDGMRFVIQSVVKGRF
jgi:hypothetical protein